MPLNLKLNKKHFLLSLGLGCIFASFQMMPQFHPFGRGKTTNTTITILLWYWPFNVPYSLKDDVCLRSYSISGCRLVDNRSLYSTADIVVFHHHELKLGSQALPLHLPRPVWQRWLWLSLEAPPNNGNVRKYAGVFNLTMSYDPSADITIPYGEIIKKDGGTLTDDFVLPKNKTHLVCWVVSNYKNHQKRVKVYQQLREFIPVQVYGRAVRKALSQGALLPTISHCHFYLAFENTEAPHYITEKLWRNSYMAGTVPVVSGPPRSHYEAVSPPHSFIHVDDFDSIASMARFLRELAGDAKRYKAYFAWHKNYMVKLYTDWRERLCDICLVYDKLPYHKVHHKLGYDLDVSGVSPRWRYRACRENKSNSLESVVAQESRCRSQTMNKYFWRSARGIAVAAETTSKNPISSFFLFFFKIVLISGRALYRMCQSKQPPQMSQTPLLFPSSGKGNHISTRFFKHSQYEV